METKEIKVTRAKINNTFGAEKIRYGIQIKKDPNSTKNQWLICSWKISYNQRFKSKFEANLWCYKNWIEIKKTHAVL